MSRLGSNRGRSALNDSGWLSDGAPFWLSAVVIFYKSAVPESQSAQRLICHIFNRAANL